MSGGKPETGHAHTLLRTDTHTHKHTHTPHGNGSNPQLSSVMPLRGEQSPKWLLQSAFTNRLKKYRRSQREMALEEQSQ